MDLIARQPAIRLLLQGAIRIEAWWFDRRHHVQTRVDEVEDLWSKVDLKEGYWYIPTRPSVARRVLRLLPVGRYADYTFVDLGSGKGRMLFIASEYPFKKIVGVEFSKDLHDRATENVRRFRHGRAKCSNIECIWLDAASYDFPPGNLVIYLYNPFGGEVMAKVIRRLEQSFEDQPREIVVVYVHGEPTFPLHSSPHFQLCSETKRCSIFRTRPFPT